jgi:uncharacterized protein with HEPN domain
MNSLPDDDLLRLRHMRDAAGEVVAFTANASQADLINDLKLKRALMMSVGIIGEAASHLSESIRSAHPEIAWRDIIAMRNYLFHVYYNIHDAILWKTATVSVPELIRALDAFLPENSTDVTDFPTGD